MRFARKLHGYSHLHLEDMRMLCARGGVLKPILEQAFRSVFAKYTACKTTGRPLHARKVSLKRIFSFFNEHIQVDFMFVHQFDNLPILHMVDAYYGFSEIAFMESREMGLASKELELRWINQHDPPHVISCDL